MRNECPMKKVGGGVFDIIPASYRDIFGFN